MCRTCILKVLIFCVLFVLKVNGAEYGYLFEHLSTEQGLSHGSVSGMLRDRYGFMWFATWDGINRYDGHSFSVYKPGNMENNYLASNRIEKIREDLSGNIWVFTYDSKAFRFDRYRERFDPVPGTGYDGSQVVVNDMLATASGAVWISSANQGVFLVETDKESPVLELTHFHWEGPVPLPDNHVVSMKEDCNGNIWVNTQKGIACLAPDPLTGKFSLKPFSIQVSKTFEKYTITSIYPTARCLYFGTTSGALLSYQPETRMLNEILLPNLNPISIIIGTSNGTLYIGTSGNGIFEYKEWVGKTTRHFTEHRIREVLNMHIDSKGLLWIESNEAGISKINLQTSQYRHYQQLLDVNPDLRSVAQCGLMEDAENTLWLTLKGGGFGYYNRTTDEVEYFFNKPGDKESRMSNFVNCFYKDASGVLWLSTYFKGIEKVTFIDPQFRLIQPAPQSNLSIANEVRALLEDSKGYLWVATKKQEIFLLDKDFKIVKKIDQINGRQTGMVYVMTEGPSGHIYLGTKGNGLFKLTRKGALDFDATQYLNNPSDSFSLSNNNIYSVHHDQQGRIWIGTYGGGINLMNQDQFIHQGNLFRNYPSGKAMRIRHIAEDAEGNLWMGATDGILHLNPGNKLPAEYSFHLFNKELGNVKGLTGSDVFWIFPEGNGNIWTASLGGGLAQFRYNKAKPDPLVLSTLSRADGLPSDVIFTIFADKAGILWMSTENGIASYNPRNKVVRNYNSQDGIINPVFSEASLAIRKEGQVCFGANNGVYSFKPEGLSDEQKRVNLLFTQFQLLGKEVFPGEGSVLTCTIREAKSIKLKHNQNAFGIAWAGIDYKLQSKISYAFKLEGYDPDWQFAGNNNQASYSRIPPGNYRFMVKFNNPELQELNPPISVKIEVLQPFWKTTWAYLFYLLLAIAVTEVARNIITSMIRLRNKVVIEKELTDIKLNFFTNVSHELRTPLTLILGPARELKKKEELSEKGKAYANLIEQNASRLLRLVNQLLDFRKIQSRKMELMPNKVDMIKFVNGICSSFNELALEKKIRFTVSVPATDIFAWIDEDKMASVLYNLLSNAFKFTPDNGAIEVTINESIAENAIFIEIKDSGIGIPDDEKGHLFEVFSNIKGRHDPSLPGTGIGLALSKELVQLHGGELTYLPTLGGGATFRIRLKADSGTWEQNKKSQSVIPQDASSLFNQQRENRSVVENENLPLLLVVEDNSELRDFLQLQLSGTFIVEGAADGQEGFDKAVKLLPDIILTDIMMPIMDGIQMLDKIKHTFETSHIPVILLTAKTSVESRIEGLKYGADAYLTKPFHPEQLNAQLENLMQQRVLLRECYTNRSSKEPTTTSGKVLTDKDARFLDQVRVIIEENLVNSDFKIESIYNSLAMGRSKFFDKLKGLTGLSPIDFVREFRLNHAKDLLESGTYNVTEVSYLSGFTDSGYFSKCFKERFGVNPSKIIP